MKFGVIKNSKLSWNGICKVICVLRYKVYYKETMVVTGILIHWAFEAVLSLNKFNNLLGSILDILSLYAKSIGTSYIKILYCFRRNEQFRFKGQIIYCQNQIPFLGNIFSQFSLRSQGEKLTFFDDLYIPVSLWLLN